MAARNTIPIICEYIEFSGYTELIGVLGTTPSLSADLVVHAFGTTLMVVFSMLKVM